MARPRGRAAGAARGPRVRRELQLALGEHRDGDRRVGDADFHIYSKATLPPPDDGCWLFQYAPRRGSNPEVLAASGSDRTLSVHMGGWRGQDALARCVTAIRAPSTFPDGVTQITLHTRIAADTATGRRRSPARASGA